MVALGASLCFTSGARALCIFERYRLEEQFVLPAGAGPIDVTPDGRVVTLVGADVYVETEVQSRVFELLGALPGTEIPDFGAAFLRVSPDGTRIAVGNNRLSPDFKVGVFDVPLQPIGTLTGVWYVANHYEAEWYDDVNLALTAFSGNVSVVTMLDTTSADAQNPTNPTVIGNIDGASGGVAFDAQGNLYTGNGFQFGPPDKTGQIKAFSFNEWSAALASQTPIDFESSGTIIIDLLSAGSLGFDAAGNMHVGGGDFFGTSGDVDFAGLVRAQAVETALMGGGEIDPTDSFLVRRLDPDSAFNFSYAIVANHVTRELYLSSGGSTVYVYRFTNARVPAVSNASAMFVTSMLGSCAVVVLRRRRDVCI